MPADTPSHPLDNPMWNSLFAPGAPVSGTDLARRIDLEGLTASALADHSAAALADLAGLFAPGEQTMLFEARPPSALPEFMILHHQPLLQMVAERPAPPRDPSIKIVELTAADVQQIARLVDLTQPGPFVPQLLDLGPFFGIRADGLLVAIAAERTHVPGYREISTVCTHPDYQRRGYARQLIWRAMRDIERQGETPFLHVSAENTSAIQLYEKLGFRKRADIEIIILMRV